MCKVGLRRLRVVVPPICEPMAQRWRTLVRNMRWVVAARGWGGGAREPRQATWAVELSWRHGKCSANMRGRSRTADGTARRTNG